MLTFPLVCKRERVSRGLVLVAAGGRVRGHYDEGHHHHHHHQLGDHGASVSAGTRVGTPDHPPPAYIYTTTTELLRPLYILRSDI